MIVQNFYTRVTLAIRNTIDSQAGGDFMRMTSEECYDLLEKIAHNTHLWGNPRALEPKKAGIYELDSVNYMNARFDQLTQLLNKQFGKFLEVLKKLYINVPFTEALSQMPSYAKFLKEILSNKRRLEDYDTINLGEQCSSIIQKKLPPKLKDPGVFSIPCHIGDNCVANALCDLGASVSLMPLSIYEKLNMGELKPTNMYLSLADRSIKYPEGILENVPIKVGKFYIPVDFVILDMEEDTKVPILLGRPFLANWCIN
ncbi:hypothetical protein P3X46_026448 [Hevea brasiliensis]|uniref:Aspartic peptidase DDI1-type domain-containing protein n=1 Tax=Hevea brasiliensis TaxID=3981 RepID=A0ABQ9KXU3_HEVBR|nr:hypothetical protein P3X46_026448 [Hevea brasiliensis]